MSRLSLLWLALCLSPFGCLLAGHRAFAAAAGGAGNTAQSVSACGSGPTRLVAPPPLAYRTSGASLRAASWPPTVANGTASFSLDGIEATLRRLDAGQWELAVAARTTQIEEVRFPWWPPEAMGRDTADDWTLYISANTGAAASAAEIRRGFGATCDSPGLCVSPVLIWATAGEGFLSRSN